MCKQMKLELGLRAVPNRSVLTWLTKVFMTPRTFVQAQRGFLSPEEVLKNSFFS